MHWMHTIFDGILLLPTEKDVISNAISILPNKWTILTHFNLRKPKV